MNRNAAIAHYHELLAQDRTLSPRVLQNLHGAMRRQRLVYGDRPIGVSLRPHLLANAQFKVLTKTAELVASALEKVAATVVQSPALMAQLGLTELEQKLAIIDPGFPGAAITSRIDGFVHRDQIKFVEYNGENPSSLSDQEGINRVLSELLAMSSFGRRYKLQQFSPARQLLETLLVTWREWGGNGLPQIAIVDWKNLPTSNEFILLQEYFQSHRVPTIVCSPDELEYERGKLRTGSFEIDLVYKRVVIHEFLARYDDTHPLVRAYRNHDVCVVNPFRCKIMHKKASFEALTDETCAKLFTAPERRAIARSIPWTRRMTHRTTTHQAKKIDLPRFVRANRKRLVLKPNDDYGGHGVYIGAHLDQPQWEAAMGVALAADYVVQEAIELRTEKFPVFTEDGWKLQPMFVDTNPFLFRGKVCGAMVRLSHSPVVNVTSGGGETGFFVLDGIQHMDAGARKGKQIATRAEPGAVRAKTIPV